MKIFGIELKINRVKPVNEQLLEGLVSMGEAVSKNSRDLAEVKTQLNRVEQRQYRGKAAADHPERAEVGQDPERPAPVPFDLTQSRELTLEELVQMNQGGER